MTTQSSQTMGERVKALREAKNLNQDELARQIGCRKSTLSLLERGHTKKLNAIYTEACAAALCTTPGYLLYGDPTPPGRMAHVPKPLVELSVDVLQVARDYEACPAVIRTAARELLKMGAGRI